MDYLKDDNLKAIDYIKEIDTLAIVEKASKIKEKRKNKLLVICFALMIITSVLGLGLFVILFGANNSIFYKQLKGLFCSPFLLCLLYQNLVYKPINRTFLINLNKKHTLKASAFWMCFVCVKRLFILKLL